MTNINYFDNQHNWVGYFIINSLDNTKFKVGDLDGNSLDVKLTIDGIEFDFISVVEHIGKHYDDTVKREAVELMKEKMNNDLFGRISEMSYQAGLLEEELTNKFQELIQM